MKVSSTTYKNNNNNGRVQATNAKRVNPNAFTSRKTGVIGLKCVGKARGKGVGWAYSRLRAARHDDAWLRRRQRHAERQLASHAANTPRFTYATFYADFHASRCRHASLMPAR